MVVAHRGGRWPGVPENSLAAFGRAIHCGADMVELDVRRTRDGHLVVCHDPTIEGRPLAALSLADLRARPAAPPTLEEAVACCAGQIAMDVEIKEPDATQAVVDRLSGVDDDALLLTSFHPSVVAAVRAMPRRRRAGLLLGPAGWPGAWQRPASRLLERASQCGADLMAPHHSLVDEALRVAASRDGIPLLPWTVNQPRRLRQLLEGPPEQILGVVTDAPVAALVARGSTPAGSPLLS